MLQSKMRWKQKEIDDDQIQHFQQSYGISSLVAKLLISRGWTEHEGQQILNVEEQEFHDPYLLSGMEQAVERIHHAVTHNQKIRIYGDYDCDGVSSTTIMIHTLRELHADFDYYIPNRFTEGYGLNTNALDRAKEDQVDLIITVDTGISAREEIEYGKQIGLEIIVTDHHEPPPELPECTAVINPKQPQCTYPYPYLAGAGVALKLAHALLQRLPMDLIDIATIGTIADLVPLTGENRLIAYYGLKQLNRTKHVGLEALIHTAGLENEQINEEHIGFGLGPRINASGRLESADTAVELLTADHFEEAQVFAQEIEQLNNRRQKLVEKMTKQAVAWVEEKYPTHKPKALVVAQEEWHEGVIGIVASKLVEKYYVPTVVLSIDPEKGMAKGSARSIEGFDMYQALRQCEELLPHFGGHPMAAGMSLPVENVAALRTKLDQLAEQWLRAEDFIPITAIDIHCEIDEITVEAIEELNRLAPFGVENPKPTVLLKQLDIAEMKQVGAHKNHLKCVFQSEEHRLDAIGFFLGSLAYEISSGAKVDIIGRLDINEWNGMRKAQIQLMDCAVHHQQFFDYRGTKPLQQVTNSWHSKQKIARCQFRPNTESNLKGMADAYGSFLQVSFDQQGRMECQSNEQEHHVWTEEELQDVKTFILVDLPQSFEQLQQACEQIRHGQRFYLCFHHQSEHFFSTVPTREHFKWYYALLRKQGTFDLQQLGPKLAEHKGWSLDSIHFMTEVFLELGFAKMDKGKLTLTDTPMKRDLTQSLLYQQKQEEIQLEQELIYSSYDELTKRLQKLLLNEEKKEEALSYGP